jgi:hypothetical protein
MEIADTSTTSICVLRELYGGAMQIEIPVEFEDLSQFREV